MRRLSVLVVEDHALMVAAIKSSLSRSPKLVVAGVATSGSEAIAMADRLQPDVVLLDLSLPGVDGFDLLRALRREDRLVVILSAHDSPESVEGALRAGAAAFISKRIDHSDLPAALWQALDPTLFQPPRLRADPAGSLPDGQLTDRELDVLRALADGLSNREIAKRLWLSEQTVKFHLTSIYRKLDVSSRTEALAAAYDRGHT